MARGKGLLKWKDQLVNHLLIRTSDQMDTGWPGSQYLQGSLIPIDESSKEVLSFSPQMPFTTLDGGYTLPYGLGSAKLPLTHPSPSFSCGSARIPRSAKRLKPTRKDSSLQIGDCVSSKAHSCDSFHPNQLAGRNPSQQAGTPTCRVYPLRASHLPAGWRAGMHAQHMWS
ncbi:calcium channel protein [Puccinia graminis f. sp. tritici]|uniref:Calcium channel protein n=1 Tax=Puccinia graminis f. sp. tritici TaxID=56615 RepID=A0A5B0NUB8_PUCGR|nr:calcium channel protein [Puccinia graminis f. sp. tritici]KAA1092104.1 calcium channel protein [Puccinia graminis f. sp. tritici]